MQIFTIGFTKKSAAQFFGALRDAKIEQVLDVRLNNVSQLAGFTKRDDLAFFVRELCGADYRHETMLAPTQAILDRYKKGGGSPAEFQREFRTLIAERRIEQRLDRGLFTPRTVLLCSEPTAEHCHRRVVVDYLAEKWKGVTAVHL